MQLSEARSSAGSQRPAAQGASAGGRRLLKTAIVVVGVVVAVSAAYGLLRGPRAEGDVSGIPTFPVRRGTMMITVTERGSVWAMDPLKITSKVEGWNTILEIVDEGTIITEQDVKNGKVLVKLDSSELEQKEADRQISYYKAEAALQSAEARYEIQKKQNESDLALARLGVKFARMELERYLGKELARDVIETGLRLDSLAGDPRLGGLAQNQLRSFEANVLLASSELTNQVEQLNWTKQLYEKQYVSRNELTTDELRRQRSQVNLDAARQELELFKKYTLPREAEQRLSDYIEKQRDLERVKAQADSRLVQAEASLKSAQASFELAQERLQKVREMIANCTIRAPKPGIVIYGTSGQEMTHQQYSVEEGASVPENAVLIRIPDVNDLAVKTNVPERDIDKLRVGQPALIVLEAEPDHPIRGRVAKISPMANPEQAWLNPEAKVYKTEVALLEPPVRFIPGMSAKVIVVCDRLDDVLFIPIQALVTYKGESFCWVKGSDQPRRVATGRFSDKYVQILSGLKEGEEVYLAPPRELDESITRQIEASQAQQRAAAEARRAAPGRRKRSGRPGGGTSQQETPPGAAPTTQSPYVSNGQIDWAKIGQALEGLSPEQKGKKFMEIINTLPEKQRKEALEYAQKWASQGGQGGRPGDPGGGT